MSFKKLKKPQRGIWPTKLWNSYLSDREALIDEIFEASGDMSLAELARKAGVCYQTVLNLNAYITGSPSETTTWKLARAVGLHRELKRVVPKSKSKAILKFKKAI